MPSQTRHQHKRQQKQSGGGYMTTAEFFGAPNTYAAAAADPQVGGIMTDAWARTAIQGMTGGGKRNRSRKAQRGQRGGFTPGLLGAFAANVETMAVPLGLYLLYRGFVKKVGDKGTRKAAGSKPATRKAGARK